MYWRLKLSSQEFYIFFGFLFSVFSLLAHLPLQPPNTRAHSDELQLTLMDFFEYWGAQTSITKCYGH